MPDNPIPQTRFGSSDRMVTRVGLGGEGVLRTVGHDAQARAVIAAALDCGITYFDSARVYADSEVYLGRMWRDQPETRRRIFQASKSASRDKAGARQDLADTFTRLQTDYLDLWQIHDVRTEDDLNRIAAPGGALEAFVEARDAGKVRRIGVTGHHDPAILTRAVKQWPVDAVMLPVNPAEANLKGFLTSTLPTARKKGLAVIAMKVLGGSHYIQTDGPLTADLLIRYAFSWDITMAIVGCYEPSHVQTLAQAGSTTQRFNEQEKAELEALFAPHARRLAFYRGVI